MFDEELAELARMVVREFSAADARIASVESCTGGLIAACITSIDGSSAVFDRGFLTYSNASKEAMVQVSADILEEHGAVSAECASAMASGGLKAAGVDACVAVTGIAGPGGGSESKPVGLVFVAVATVQDEGTFVERFEFGDIGREQVRRETVKEALEMLLGYGTDETTH